MTRKRGNGEGSVYQEKSGRWIAAVTVDGKRKRAVAKTEAAAKRRLREMLHQVDDGRPIGDGSMTVKSLLEMWTAGHLLAQNLAPPTIETYMWATAVLTRELGSKRLKTLAPEHVEAAFQRLAEGDAGSGRRPLSRASLVKIRSVLGKALHYAERRQYVSRNIARVVELPAGARRAKVGRALTLEQAELLLDELEGDRLEALFVVCLMLALRPGEASGLAWSSIDFEAERLHIRQSLKLHHGELVVTAAVKTRRSRRGLQMPRQVIDALLVHRDRQETERLACGEAWSNPGDLVFTNEVGGPIDPANLRRRFRQITENAGLGAWHPHELRHSAASLLAELGVPHEEIAEMFGHDGTDTTKLVYIHPVTPSVQTPKRMDEIFRTRDRKRDSADRRRRKQR